MCQPRTWGNYKSPMLSRGIIATLDAQWCKKKKNKKKREERKHEKGDANPEEKGKKLEQLRFLVHETQHKLRQHRPRHRWMTEDAQWSASRPASLRLHRRSSAAWRRRGRRGEERERRRDAQRRDSARQRGAATPPRGQSGESTHGKARQSKFICTRQFKVKKQIN